MITCLQACKGIGLGMLFGLIDITPMIIMRLPAAASLSAFSMWTVAGFVIATSGLSLIPPYLQGIILSLGLLLPSLILIIHQSSFARALPIVMVTIVLGAILGFLLK